MSEDNNENNLLSLLISNIKDNSVTFNEIDYSSFYEVSNEHTALFSFRFLEKMLMKGSITKELVNHAKIFFDNSKQLINNITIEVLKEDSDKLLGEFDDILFDLSKYIISQQLSKNGTKKDLRILLKELKIDDGSKKRYLEIFDQKKNVRAGNEQVHLDNLYSLMKRLAPTLGLKGDFDETSSNRGITPVTIEKYCTKNNINFQKILKDQEKPNNNMNVSEVVKELRTNSQSLKNKGGEDPILPFRKEQKESDDENNKVEKSKQTENNKKQQHQQPKQKQQKAKDKDDDKGEDDRDNVERGDAKGKDDKDDGPLDLGAQEDKTESESEVELISPRMAERKKQMTEKNFVVPKIRRAKLKWTDEETSELKRLMEKFGTGNWSRILANGNFDPHRTSTDLRDKWRNIEKARQRDKLAILGSPVITTPRRAQNNRNNNNNNNNNNDNNNRANNNNRNNNRANNNNHNNFNNNNNDDLNNTNNETISEISFVREEGVDLRRGVFERGNAPRRETSYVSPNSFDSLRRINESMELRREAKERKREREREKEREREREREREKEREREREREREKERKRKEREKEIERKKKEIERLKKKNDKDFKKSNNSSRHSSSSRSPSPSYEKYKLDTSLDSDSFDSERERDKEKKRRRTENDLASLKKSKKKKSLDNDSDKNNKSKEKPSREPSRSNVREKVDEDDSTEKSKSKSKNDSKNITSDRSEWEKRRFLRRN
eukprot:TRINITY_DN285_c0_g1_i1.p1 TRINITY_DN285_c0_g1~~TRINITY_DN285_c0_g1_i1.p1  ORF type:complete len:726 (-),score=286.32 TRINITY_DN285_c0_g1_i1:99-2276(-)